jgi:lysophospholipase L1-like esterase
VKYLICLTLLMFASARAFAAPVVEFHDTERVVFLGNEFFDHEIDQCYIEARLTSRFPGKDLTFRNLGYSGDNVWADARTLCSGWDQFGPADQGFERLRKLLGKIKPTLIFVSYGMNESFAGRAGLEHFQDGLNRMLDMLTTTGARVVLISPIPHENLGPPLPNPESHNRDLALYTDAIRQTAARRSMPFIDLIAGMAEQSPPAPGAALTTDGIHLTPAGYRKAADVIERQLGYSTRGWGINIDAANGNLGATAITVKDLSHSADRVSFTATAQMLPVETPAPDDQVPLLQVKDLQPGSYALKIDGHAVATASAQDWAAGVRISSGPDADQARALRTRIVEKDFDFFNYWRPENDTYIFGYRKHEQGRNAVEIPRFDEMIPAKESEIAKLRGPLAHNYVLQAAGKKD